VLARGLSSVHERRHGESCEAHSDHDDRNITSGVMLEWVGAVWSEGSPAARSATNDRPYAGEKYDRSG
jgi:hypothetical protein